MVQKVDNANLPAKLDLRRYFLRKYHADGQADVLDCCQGRGVLWSTLRAEFPVRSYWGLDEKPKKGRLRLDSARVLAQPGWPQNVVDVDTYGSPWKHWGGLSANLSRPTTVFLTIGQWQMGTDRALLDALGLGRLRIPPGIAVKLQEIAISYILTRGCGDLLIMEAVEAFSTGTARYVGLRIEPKRADNAVGSVESQAVIGRRAKARKKDATQVETVGSKVRKPGH